MKPDITPERRRQILIALVSKVCVCGGPKKASMSHCRDCFYTLPGELRRKLWFRFCKGYEEAFEESVAYLHERKAKI